jgi:hypothetical protein
VEHTFDDVYAANFDPATAVWYANSGISGATSSTSGNYAFPVTAVRVRVSVYGSGNVTMTVVQAGGK